MMDKIDKDFDQMMEKMEKEFDDEMEKKFDSEQFNGPTHQYIKQLGEFMPAVVSFV